MRDKECLLWTIIIIIFKKIDAHSGGKFGSPFNIDFDLRRLTEQVEAYNIEKTILCPAGCHLNEELKTAYQGQLGQDHPTLLEFQCQ